MAKVKTVAKQDLPVMLIPHQEAHRIAQTVRDSPPNPILIRDLGIQIELEWRWPAELQHQRGLQLKIIGKLEQVAPMQVERLPELIDLDGLAVKLQPLPEELGGRCSYVEK